MLYDVLSAVYSVVPKEKRATVCKKLIRVFEDDQCDNVHDAFDRKWPELETEYYKLHPEHIQDEYVECPTAGGCTRENCGGDCDY